MRNSSERPGEEERLDHVRIRLQLGRNEIAAQRLGEGRTLLQRGEGVAMEHTHRDLQRLQDGGGEVLGEGRMAVDQELRLQGAQH